MSTIAQFQQAPVCTERLPDNTIWTPAYIPSGWSIWGSDGRIYPPADAVYRVDAWGAPARLRTAEGTFQTLSAGAVLRIKTSEAIMPPSSGTPGGIALHRIA